MTAKAIRLRNECDELCRQLVRRRVMCERCMQQRGTDTAHLVPRRYAWTRCELDNLALMCRSCHSAIDTAPAMKDAFAVDQLGQSRWDELQRKAEDNAAPVGERFWQIRRDYLRAQL